MIRLNEPRIRWPNGPALEIMKTSICRFALALGLALSGLPAGGAEQLSLTFSSVGSSEQIPATLIRPDGEGPFPAVVVMHDCSGLGAPSSGAPMRWAKELLSQGYVALIPDSFTPRGVADGVCTLPSNQARVANGYVRAGDAYGALAALRKLPYVDAKRIGIMGGSHGGWTTLAAMAAPMRENNPVAEAKRDGFAAAVALYPSCTLRYGTWSTVRQNESVGPVVSYSGVYEPIAPVLILIGEKDDWNPAEACRQLVATSAKAGYPLEIKIYPGVHHSFDSDRPLRYDPRRTNINSPSGHGATTGGDPAAWSDAKKQVASFFGRYLKP
jgi:dienelactone hydrolase